MIIKCAWHPRNFGEELTIREDEHEPKDAESHGMCPECFRLELEKTKDRPS